MSFQIINSCPKKPRSFWSAPRIAAPGRDRLFEDMQRIRFVLSANRICQTWLWAWAEWREVCYLRTSGVGPSQNIRNSCCWPKNADENAFKYDTYGHVSCTLYAYFACESRGSDRAKFLLDVPPHDRKTLSFVHEQWRELTMSLCASVTVW